MPLAIAFPIYLFILGLIGLSKGLEFKQISASLDNVYSFDIKDEERHAFIYQINASEFGNPEGTSLRIKCEIERHEKDNESCPLIILVRQKRTLVIWKIPETTGINSTVYNKLDRTICIDSADVNNTDRTFVFEISYCSTIAVSYMLSVSLKRDVLIPINKLMRADIIPLSPKVFRYKFPDCPSDFAFIQLTSSSNSCMIMSIQQPQCPIVDRLETIQNKGHWQSVTTKTGMNIRKEQYPNGFFIIFLLLPDDTRCTQLFGVVRSNSSSGLARPRQKAIQFTIRDNLPINEYHKGVSIPLGIFLTFVTLIFFIHLHFHRMRCNLVKQTLQNVASDSTDTLWIAIRETRNESESKMRSRIHISELIKDHPERLMEQSKRYYTSGLLVTSFYCVPVFQLILSFHKRLQETGNFDLCYFNYLCSHMLGKFDDFNHIYSNIGYIICGAVFVINVLIRQHTIVSHMKFEELAEDKSTSFFPKAPSDISKGVFVHFGLFYAMGLALCMTGVMSAAYHICPNQNNFQFDTAFMYTIAALGTITIYQFRHPTYVSASSTFMTLAIVAASTVLGLLWESTTFRVFFTASHVTFLIVILTYIHYVGYVRVNGNTVTEWKVMARILTLKWKSDARKFNIMGFQKEPWSPEGEPSSVVLPGPCRLIFPVLTLGINSGALIMVWTLMQEANFASQVLAVYVINCSVYTIYYSVMKVIHGECRGKLWLQPLFYLVISICLWASSLLYFKDVVTLWERSPAESRARNAECIFLGFYDSHDVWHFISSSALFSSLMVLLTMDDDLVTRSKSQIPVF